MLAVVPRLAARLTGGGRELPVGPGVWRGTALLLPDGIARQGFRDAFTGAILETGERDGGRILRLADVLAGFPVALLEGAGPGGG